jgi:hypothetical protein
MNFATKLHEILEWVSSHAARLRRKDYEPPNHLANGTVRVFMANDVMGPTFIMQLDAKGKPPDLVPSHPVMRIEVRDSAEAILYTEDFPEGLNP